MSIGRRIVWLSLGLLWLGWLPGAIHAETIERIVAVVNGDVVLYGDVLEQMKMVEKIAPGLSLQDPEQKAKAEREVLQSLIRQRLAEQEVKKLKIVVGKGEIDNTINELKRDSGMSDAQFEQALSRDGMNLKQFRDKVKLELERSRLMDRVIKSKIVVKETQIDERMQSPVSSAPSPSPSPKIAEAKERRRLGMIFLPLPENPSTEQLAQGEKLARKVLGKIKESGDFPKAAREYSRGPGSYEGGDIGFVSPDELAPEIDKGLEGLSVGAVSDVIKTSRGFYILKILEVRKDAPPQLQSKAETPGRESVRRQLFMEELNRKYEEWIRELEKKAFIKITL
jgi:peptidyl-prolyl cis-trans isomerase SurA